METELMVVPLQARIWAQELKQAQDLFHCYGRIGSLQFNSAYCACSAYNMLSPVSSRNTIFPLPLIQFLLEIRKKHLPEASMHDTPISSCLQLQASQIQVCSDSVRFIIFFPHLQKFTSGMSNHEPKLTMDTFHKGKKKNPT